MPLYVAKPSLPKLSDFKQEIKKIYKTHKLTTNGPQVNLLEERLKKFLGVKNLLLVSNGTMAIQIALETLKISQKVSITPFSYVSTVNAVEWQKIPFDFCDLEKDKLTIDIKKLKLKKNGGLLVVHPFGIPEKINKLTSICKKKKVKLLFDASHCFDIKYKKKSILDYGDASIISFQATKFFNTCEGGAIVFKSKKDYLAAHKLIHIGYNYLKKKDILPSRGINAKINELSASWGISLLKRVNEIKLKKKRLSEIYFKNLNLNISKPTINLSKQNYNYMPIIFKNEKNLLKVKKKLEKNKIYPRRYFYPSLDELPHIKKNLSCKNSRNICRRILCLPLSEYISKKEILKICKIVNSNR